MATLDQKYAPIVVRDRDDIGSNRSSNRPLLELPKARMSRRAALKGFVTTAAVGALGPTLTSRLALAAGGGPSTLGFQSLEQVIKEDHQVAPGYSARVLIRWGDPVLAGAPDFDPMRQTADAQAKQFGYNCDYLAFFPLPRGSDSSGHGLLHVNHEYTSQELMFPGWAKLDAAEGKPDKERPTVIGEASLAAQTPEQTRIEMMAHQWLGDRGPQGERRLDGGAAQPVRAPDHARDRDRDRRPGGRPRPPQDQCRSDWQQGAGHAQ